MTIAAHRASWSAGGRMVVDGVTLEVRSGGMLGLLGPNGSGKSSLLRLLAGLRRVSSGAVTLGGKDISAHRRGVLARRVAVVEQQVATEAPVTALDIVRLGRTPHRGLLSAWTAEDEAAVRQALLSVGLDAMASRSWHTLSGGERQRVQIARALAQLAAMPRPAALLLDEPTASLDPGQRASLLRLLRRLAAEGLAILIVLHDLNEAAFVADRVALLAGGRLLAEGPPVDVLQPARLAAVYGVGFRALDVALLPDYARVAHHPG